MGFIFQSISGHSCRRLPQNRHQTLRAFGDAAGTIIRVRDRALDHAVEKEKNLFPLINLKNFIKAEPSKTLPITVIADNKDSLAIPIRPIDFIRRYRTIFEEFRPGGVGIHPHVRLTPEVLELDAEEQLIYQSEGFQNQAADRLLKLLMLCRLNKVPLKLIDQLKWDLGLPQDYLDSLVPQFPDYFQVSKVKDSSNWSDIDVLELVCWSSDLAVSAIEKKTMKKDLGKGLQGAFPVKYTRGFEMDKNMKKWLDEWQKLPYVSPYENAMHLPPKSDESDKWAVAVMHELLHILIPKKTDKEILLCLGEYMGLRSRFKKALLHHPGIFYVSSKNRMHTVVLREGYKRDLLIEKHQMVNMRYRYIHLMNTVKDAPKAAGKMNDNAQKQQKIKDSTKVENEAIGRSEEDGNDFSQSDVEETSDEEYADTDDDDDDDYEDDEGQSRASVHRDIAIDKGRRLRTEKFEPKMSHTPERSSGRYPNRRRDKNLSHERVERRDFQGSSSRAPVSSRSKRNSMPGKRTFT